MPPTHLFAACVLCALIGPGLAAVYINNFDMEVYNASLESIPKRSSCFSKTAISSFCWPCNGSAAMRSRYLYRSRCIRAYGPASAVRLLSCPRTNKKNFCYMTCDTLGQMSCCSNHFGPLCLSCPKDRPFGSSRSKSVCSNRGSCRSGISGTGLCSCGYRFRGTACQKCRPGYFGMYCQYRCNCRHGYCLGRSSTRHCICKSGWTGTYCTKRSPKCNSKQCGPNERCVSSGSCICKTGFSGANCTEQELCTKTSCSPQANCTTIYSSAEARRKVSCKCWPGFTGDGTHCLLQNPCKKIRCRLHETCLIINRGQPSCICTQGYERKNGTCVKKKCSRPELCPKNAVCKFASAYLYDQKCDCKKGYYSRQCIPSLGQIIKEMNTNPRLRGKIPSLNIFTSYNLEPNLVRRTARTTVLLPLKLASYRDYFRSSGANRHIILTYVNASNMTVWNLYGDKLHFTLFNTTSNSNFTEPIGEIKVGNISINIMQQRDFSSGRVYVIQQEILDPLDRYYSPTQRSPNLTKFLETISVPMANLYSSWLKKRYRRLPRNYRLLIFPVKGFTKHELEYLKSNDSVARYKLKYYLESTVKELRYWRYTDPIVHYNRNSKYNSRYRNQRHQFKFTKQGQWYLSGSLVVANFIRVGRYIVLLVNQPLVSSIVTPILPGQCHQKQTVTLKVPYSSTCPAGTKLVSRRRWVHAICQRDIIITRQCCPGFYGPACEFHCPGPYGIPCYNNGKCFDGLKGNGQCYCKEPFSGLECEKCAFADTFGKDCNQTCPCRRGKCDGGTIFGTGKCLTCENGYTGDYCHKKIIHCYNTTLECGLHQHCESDDVSAPRCVCDQGYRRNRTGCYPHNPCTDPNRNFGGCNGNSICKFLGPGNSTCVCRDGWTGDGVVCEKQWTMCKSNHDCKINGSICIRGNCRCANGRSIANNSCDPHFDCSVNNGGCHPAAVCHPRAPNYNSHCKCRDGDPGDGFLCLELWWKALETHNVLQGTAFNSISKFYYRLYVRMRWRKYGVNTPLTIFFTRKLAKFQRGTYYKKMSHLVVKGLYFVEKAGENYLSSNFFPKETPYKLTVTKKGNVTYIQGVRVLKENIYVREGLLHILDMPLMTQPTGTKMFSNASSSPPDSSSSTGPWLAYPHKYLGKDYCSPPTKPMRLTMSIVPTETSPTYAFRSISKAIRRLLFIHGNAMWFGVTYSLMYITQKMRFCIAKPQDLPKVPGCYTPFYSDLKEPLCPKGFSVRRIFHQTAPPPTFQINFSVRASDLPFQPQFRHSLRGAAAKMLNLTELIICCRQAVKPSGRDFNFAFQGTSFNLIRNRVCPYSPGRLHTQKNYQPFDIFDIITPPYFEQQFPKLDRLTVCHYFTPRTTTSSMSPMLTTSSPAPPRVPAQVGFLVPTNVSCPSGNQVVKTRFLKRLGVGLRAMFGLSPQLCVPGPDFVWPRGKYCALANVHGTAPVTCPKNLPTRKRYFGLYSRFWYNLCCGLFLGNNTSTKDLPPRFGLFATTEFNLFMHRGLSRQKFVCPNIPGYKRIKIYSRDSGKIIGSTFALKKATNFFMFYCYYSREDKAGFSLPQPKTGCDEGLVTGFVVQRLERTDTRMPNRYMHLAGLISPNKHTIRLEFCSTITTPLRKSYVFPKGHYCIYRRGGLCPVGFVSSYAQIDDEDDLGPATALNRSGGALPDGIWGYNVSTDTRYFFCCRSDGPPTSTPVEFPFKKPFYLFKAPKQEKCQEVKGFTVRFEPLRLDAEDSRRLGKPSVIIKGDVPMSRSRVRGADIDVHYCYYHNQTSKEAHFALGFLKADSSPCPQEFVDEAVRPPVICDVDKNNCSSAPLHVCYAGNGSYSGDAKNWPRGAYCLFGKPGQVCYKDFYTVSLTSFWDGTSRICCRDDSPMLPRPLPFPISLAHNFGLIAVTDCPAVEGMMLVSRRETFPLHKDCYYSAWPNNTDFALPQVGGSCPFGMEPSLLGAVFLKNFAVASQFESSVSHKNDFFLDNLKICNSKSFHPRTTKTWPRGTYCIFSDDEKVAVEFPYAVTFRKSVTGKGLVSATFIFCKNDSRTSTLDVLPAPTFAVVAPDACPVVPFRNLAREVLLRGDPKGTPDWRTSPVNISNYFTPNAKRFVAQRLMICVYTNAKDAIDSKMYDVTFASKAVLTATRTCTCSPQIASCSSANLCRCAKQLIGDGTVCQSCRCGENAVCLPGSSLFARRCQCREGYHGDGLTCVPMENALRMPAPKPWPPGVYAFVRGYENIADCPEGFETSKSLLVGRTETFSYSVSAPVSFCAKISSGEAGKWPQGNYCVWSKEMRKCPKGLNETRLVGSFRSLATDPLVVAGKESIVHLSISRQGLAHATFLFCCRSSPAAATTSQPLVFPATDSFSLLRSGGSCPAVAGMGLIEHRLLIFRHKTRNKSISLLPKAPDVTFDPKLGSAELHVCNYHMKFDPAMDVCDTCAVPLSIYKSNETIFSIIKSDPILTDVKKVLEHCNLWTKIEHVHHIYIAIFINEALSQQLKKGSMIPCETMKDFIVFSNKQMPAILPSVKDKATFRSFGSGLTPLSVQKSTNGKEFLINGIPFYESPYVIAKNGVVYLLKKGYSVQMFTKAVGPRWVAGLVVFLLLVAAVLATLAFFYVRRRRGMTSMMNFVNPVYYRPVES